MIDDNEFDTSKSFYKPDYTISKMLQEDYETFILPSRLKLAEASINIEKSKDRHWWEFWK